MDNVILKLRQRRIQVPARHRSDWGSSARSPTAQAEAY